MGKYDKTFRHSIDDPEGFWGEAARDVRWSREPAVVLDDSQSPLVRWFPDGELNTCFNALDVHVADGRGEQDALVYDSALTGERRRYSYAVLLDRVARFAGGLRQQGVGKGDTVLVYMPMVPEAVIAMLACARLGAVHSVVFGGFAAAELAKRIEDARPDVVVTASCGLEPTRTIAYKPIVEEAIGLCEHAPRHVIVLQRPQLAADMTEHDVDFDQLLQAEPVDCVPVAATEPLYILYTSGTTGIPKGGVRDNGGHAVAMKWSLRNMYGMKPGDVFWAASDIGWVVGHSYIVYAPLLLGCTTVMFEGKPVGTPDAGAFWRVVQDYGVHALFTAPTAFRAIKGQDPQGTLLGEYDTTSLRTLFLAGEHADPATVRWAQDKLGVPVIDHWWQTETGWAIAANCVGIEALPVKPGSATRPVPGYDVRILDESGKSLAPGETGAIVVKLPLPPGCFPTLWQNDARFVESYMSRFEGYYNTEDAGYLDEDGYLFIMARTDDIINVAGHRLSTGGMEEILAAHPDVAECAVVGVKDALKGEVPVGFVVLNAGVDRPREQVHGELVQAVRQSLGAVAAFKQAAIVARLPKTRSGKVLRGTMRRIANGEAYTVTPTIEDAATLEEMAEALRELGYPSNP